MLHRSGKQWALKLIALICLVLMVGTTPAMARATTFTSSVKIPVNAIVFVPCANGGAGEAVLLSGSLHDLFHITLSDKGSVRIKSHDNRQGVSGVGLTTGTKYRGTGVNQFNFGFASHGLPFTFTFVNSFRIISQGRGNNFLVRENTHVTVKNNGALTAFVDNFSAECK